MPQESSKKVGLARLAKEKSMATDSKSMQTNGSDGGIFILKFLIYNVIPVHIDSSDSYHQIS